MVVDHEERSRSYGSHASGNVGIGHVREWVGDVECVLWFVSWRGLHTMPLLRRALLLANADAFPA